MELNSSKIIVNSIHVTFDRKSFPSLENLESSTNGDERNNWSGLDYNSNNLNFEDRNQIKKVWNVEISDSKVDIF